MAWFISIWRLIDTVRTAYDYGENENMFVKNGDESGSFHDMIIYAA
jgi:hypothetical protein